MTDKEFKQKVDDFIDMFDSCILLGVHGDIGVSIKRGDKDGLIKLGTVFYANNPKSFKRMIELFKFYDKGIKQVDKVLKKNK